MIRKILMDYKKMIVFYVLGGILQILAASLSVVVFQTLIDEVPGAKALDDLMTLLVFYGGFMVANCLLSYVDEYPNRILKEGIYHKFKLLALRKIEAIDYSAYQEIGTGSLIQMIENGAESGRNIVFDFYISLVRNLMPGVVISLFFIASYDKTVMVAIGLGYCIVFVLTNILLKYLYRIKNHLLDHEQRLSKYAIRGFMELIVFRVNKKYGRELEKIGDSSRHIVKTNAKIRMIHELFFALFECIVIVVKMFILVTGVIKVIDGQLTIGAIVALITFTDRIYTPIAIFNVLYVDYKLDTVAYKRFKDFMTLPEDGNLKNGLEVSLKKGHLAFQDIGFQYGEETLLDNLSFTIEEGSSVAFVGKSGAGKSTITKMILGLLKPTKGCIRVDGHRLNDLSLNGCYYDHITYVSQEAPVFDGTLRENMVFDDQVPEHVLYDVLDKVDLKDFVLKLPEGLNTEIGEKGTKLSGGEKQRLACARAILKPSKIVVLDEPTSALDSITEERIMKNMLEAFQDRTCIIIAHRLQTVRAVDRILVLDRGGIVESGSFEDVMAHGGLFNELWRVAMNGINDSEPL